MTTTSLTFEPTPKSKTFKKILFDVLSVIKVIWNIWSGISDSLFVQAGLIRSLE